MFSDRLVAYAYIVLIEWADKLNVSSCCCHAKCKAFWDTTRQEEQREVVFA